MTQRRRLRPRSKAIVHTFVEAIILVTLVVFIFLQNLRATIIPLLTVPVSLIGTFIFFPMLGFSVNTLSMFGLVLAIGIVVDDAIVVVEAVMHHIEHGLEPKEATMQAMKEVSAPVIGIALILSAVFVPVAFLGGLTGQMYQAVRADHRHLGAALGFRRAVALAGAVRHAAQAAPRPDAGPLGKFFRSFNRAFDRTTNGYVGIARLLVRRSILTIVIVARGGRRRRPLRQPAPRRLHPRGGSGHLWRQRHAAAGASLERTSAVLAQVEQILAKTDGRRFLLRPSAATASSPAPTSRTSARSSSG